MKVTPILNQSQINLIRRIIADSGVISPDFTH
jgi:hypothetical protein